MLRTSDKPALTALADLSPKAYTAHCIGVQRQRGDNDPFWEKAASSPKKAGLDAGGNGGEAGN